MCGWRKIPISLIDPGQESESRRFLKGDDRYFTHAGRPRQCHAEHSLLPRPFSYSRMKSSTNRDSSSCVSRSRRGREFTFISARTWVQNAQGRPGRDVHTTLVIVPPSSEALLKLVESDWTSIARPVA